MKDIRDYRSPQSIQDEMNGLNDKMLDDIKQIFNERGITTLKILVDEEGRSMSDYGFDYEQAYYNSPVIFLAYFDGDGYPTAGAISEVSIDDRGYVSVCIHNEENDYDENDFEYTSRDVVDIYTAVIYAIMRKECDGNA